MKEQAREFQLVFKKTLLGRIKLQKIIYTDLK
jgi:hypothetical protein